MNRENPADKILQNSFKLSKNRFKDELCHYIRHFPPSTPNGGLRPDRGGVKKTRRECKTKKDFVLLNMITLFTERKSGSSILISSFISPPIKIYNGNFISNFPLIIY